MDLSSFDWTSDVGLAFSLPPVALTVERQVNWAKTACELHPLATCAFVLVCTNLVMLTVRFAIAANPKSDFAVVLRSVPFLNLGVSPDNYSRRDLVVFWAIFWFIASFYTSVWNLGGRDRTLNNPIWIVENRFGITVAAMAFQTFLFKFAQYNIVHRLPEDQREAQAANVVRVTIKCSLFFYTILCGNWWHITFTPVDQLRDEDFATAYWGPLGMSFLYTWELVFRDLRPINFIHHGAALMAAWSVLEWYSDDSFGNSVRKLTPCGTIMSFTEGWCCLGTVIYRYASRQVASRVMLADALFVTVVYNAIAVWWVYTLYVNWDTFDTTSRYVSCPLILMLTYPAQMNMVKIFYTLHRKAAKAARAERHAAAVAAEGAPLIRKQTAALLRTLDGTPLQQRVASTRVAE